MNNDFGKVVSSVFPSLRWRVFPLILAFLVCFSTGITPSARHCWAQETDNRTEAKSLFAEALNLKKAGKSDDAAKSFEKALRKDRSILGEDDNGLIKLLREMYEKKVTASPEDVEALEGMGFVASVCDADYAKAIEHYSKVFSLTNDDQEKTRIKGLIDDLKAQLPSTGASSSSASGSTGSVPPSQGDEPKAASGVENLGAEEVAEANARREARLSELTSSREEKENQLPLLEAEIKNTEEENERNHRMYLSSNDRRYKRKEDAGEQTIEAKKREIEKLRKDIDRLGSQIDKLTKGEPEKTPAGGEPPTDE